LSAGVPIGSSRRPNARSVYLPIKSGTGALRD
jgi:hypothetical protein